MLYYELKYEIDSKQCKENIHTEFKQSSFRYFKCNHYSLKMKKIRENKKSSFIEFIKGV